jgi:hypothetical protein
MSVKGFRIEVNGYIILISFTSWFLNKFPSLLMTYWDDSSVRSSPFHESDYQLPDHRVISEFDLWLVRQFSLGSRRINSNIGWTMNLIVVDLLFEIFASSRS